MSAPRTAYEIATDSLKRTLKQQKLTYRELAQRIGLSESGVKKILSASDGSFGNIARITEELGLSMAELLSGQDESMFDLAYSDRQQSYFIENPRALRLYWALLYERRPLSEAQKVAGLAAKELFATLRRLDQLQLLELLPGDRLRIAPVRPVRWVGGGPLVRKLYDEWSAKFLRVVATPEQRPRELFLIRYFRASAKTAEELRAALRDLEAEFVRRAIREMRTEDPSLVHLRWMSAVDERSFLD